MELDIENLGKVEITSLPADYCWGENNINYNYVKTTLNNIPCLICDPSISVALCELLMPRNHLMESFINYILPDMSYWFYARNEYCETNVEDLHIGSLFDIYLEKGIILKVINDSLKEITANHDNYIYVFPNYEKYLATDDSEEIYKLSAEVILSEANEYYEDKVDNYKEYAEFDPDDDSIEKDESYEYRKEEYYTDLANIKNEYDSIIMQANNCLSKKEK